MTRGSLSDWASRMEFHFKEEQEKKKLLFDEIRKAEILRRHELGSEKYNRASFVKRRILRSSAYCFDLRRWV